jgi:hypothetical protein
MAKKITLSMGVAAIVDDEEYEKLNDSTWSFVNGYAYRQVWKNGKPRTEYMHRVIMGDPKGFETDHINGNGLDNRKRNLRIATRNQNMANQRPQKNTSSRYKGVSWEKRRSKWQAYIETKGHKRHLGYFDNEIDAAKAYNTAASLIFGEFARLNNLEERKVI